MGMAKCKECTHYLTCRQGNSNPDYCGLFMNYENTAEVVRCKDCVHGVWSEKDQMWKCVESAEYDKEFGDWIGFCEWHNGDFFCANGERKDNGNL